MLRRHDSDVLIVRPGTRLRVGYPPGRLALFLNATWYEVFKRAYLEKKTRLDIEYRLEELKRDIQKRKSTDELIEKVEDLEKFGIGRGTTGNRERDDRK